MEKIQAFCLAYKACGERHTLVCRDGTGSKRAVAALIQCQKQTRMLPSGWSNYIASANDCDSTRRGLFFTMSFFGRGLITLIAEASSWVFRWAA